MAKWRYCSISRPCRLCINYQHRFRLMFYFVVCDKFNIHNTLFTRYLCPIQLFKWNPTLQKRKDLCIIWQQGTIVKQHTFLFVWYTGSCRVRGGVEGYHFTAMAYRDLITHLSNNTDECSHNKQVWLNEIAHIDQWSTRPTRIVYIRQRCDVDWVCDVECHVWIVTCGTSVFLHMTASQFPVIT